MATKDNKKGNKQGAAKGNKKAAPKKTIVSFDEKSLDGLKGVEKMRAKLHNKRARALAAQQPRPTDEELLNRGKKKSENDANENENADA